ncbi:hypothetical protein R4K89_08115 [Brachyspira intermedia]|uniref:hypothetical protein n=1 Tax=Brachyspira intermedia TaxID=84377 RepID=UPI00300528D1
MFNKNAILLVIIFSLFVTSCTNYFNPYDVKDETSSDNDENIEPLPNGQGKMKLTITSMIFENIDTSSANRNALTGNVGVFGKVFDYALFGYDMKVDFYSSSSGEHSLSSFARLIPKNNYSALILSDVKGVGVSKEYSLAYEYNDDITILMSVNLTKYDEKAGDFYYKVHYPYAYSENDKIKIELKYNKNNDTFELVDIKDEYGNRIIRNSTIKSLTVYENKEAEVFMRIDGMDGPDNPHNCGNGPTGLNNKIDLTIKFKFEIIQ